MPSTAAAAVPRAARAPYLEKLVLQVAHVCNLSCTYCITQEGEFGKGGPLAYMTPQTARSAVERFAGAFCSIGVVNFFGGEPTLNLPAILAACETVDRVIDEGLLQDRPHLSMSTNGMCASDQFIDLVNRFGIRFAVSIDGPAEVNDLLRRTKGGAGTYHQIRENIARLREATGYPKGLAVTYTAAHLDSALTLWDILTALRDDLGLWDFAIMPATNSPATPGQWDPLLSDPDRFIREYQECVRRSIEEMTERDDAISIEYGKKALSHLVEEPMYEECPAGDSYFAIAAGGDVYPCQNLPETAEYRITNIDSSLFDGELHTSAIRQRIATANTDAKSVIGNRKCKSMCRICPSDNLSETGSLEPYSPQRLRFYTGIAQAATETFVTLLGNVDDARRDRLLSNLQR